MPRVSAAFFALGVVCVFFGMLWGMHMGASQDMTTMPAHAHLNLLGWVTMALYGTFYALTHASLKPRLAWTNFALSAIGIAILIPCLALYLGSHDTKYVPGLIAGQVASLLSLLVFAVSVFRELVRPRLSH